MICSAKGAAGGGSRKQSCSLSPSMREFVFPLLSILSRHSSLDRKADNAVVLNTDVCRMLACQVELKNGVAFVFFFNFCF